jgi:O-antigen ligase
MKAPTFGPPHQATFPEVEASIMSRIFRFPVFPYALVTLALPSVAMFNHRGIVPLAILLAVTTLIHLGPRAVLAAAGRIPKGILFGLLGLIAVGAVSLLWAPHPKFETVSLLKFSGNIFVLFLVITGFRALDRDEGRIVLGALWAGSFLIAIYLVSDLLLGGAVSLVVLKKSYVPSYGYFWFKAGINVILLSLIALSAHAVLSGRYIVAIGVVLLGIAIAVGIGSKTGAFGLILGASTAGVYLMLGRFRMTLLRGTFISLVASAPLLVWLAHAHEYASKYISLKMSAGQSLIYRLHIWDFVMNKIAEKWMFGWGFASSRFLGGDAWLSDARFGEIGEALPLHPHNTAMQIWLELGLAGILPLCLFLYALFPSLKAIARTRLEEFFVFTWAFAIIAHASFSYSPLSSWWIVTIGLTLGLLGLALNTRAAPVGQTPG